MLSSGVVADGSDGRHERRVRRWRGWGWGGGGGTVCPPTCPTVTPTVTSITPSLGPAAGNIAVTVSGTNFTQGASLILGGTPATGVIVESGTSIRATVAARAAGVVDVAVRNSDGQTGTLANSFWYLDANGQRRRAVLGQRS